MIDRPYFYVPSAAEPGQPLAFGDREALLRELYLAIAHAGSALRAGNRAVRHRQAVVGYMGVGKSALILRALEMLRAPPAGGAVRDPERWLIFYFSGKHYPNFEALTDGLAKLRTEDAPSERDGRPDTLLSLATEFALQAEPMVPQESAFSIFHRLLSREQKLHAAVREALSAMTSAISYVQLWRGAMLSRQEERTVQADLSRASEAALEAEIKDLVSVPATAEGNAGLKLAASILSRHGTALKSTEKLEGRWRVSSEILVDVLNNFLDQCTRAGLPTVLVLDDLDEFTSASGDSHQGRAQVLSQVLGTFHGLRPTVLLYGLRKEYMDWDVFRTFSTLEIAPATPPEALIMARAWAEIQSPPIEGEALAVLLALAQTCLSVLDPREPGVVPFRFFRFLGWLYNRGELPTTPFSELLGQFLRSNHSYFANEALRKAAETMPDDDVLRCLTTSPVDPEPYALSEQEVEALTGDGLLRPALAGDPNSRAFILDPMAAWLRRSFSR